MGRRGGPAFRRVLGARGACLAVRWWRGAGPQGWPSRLQTQFQAFSRASSAPPPPPPPPPPPRPREFGCALVGAGQRRRLPAFEAGRANRGAKRAAPGPPAPPSPPRRPHGSQGKGLAAQGAQGEEGEEGEGPQRPQGAAGGGAAPLPAAEKGGGRAWERAGPADVRGIGPARLGPPRSRAPHRLQRPLSAYMFFAKDKRTEVSAGGGLEPAQTPPARGLVRFFGRRWRDRAPPRGACAAGGWRGGGGACRGRARRRSCWPV